MQNQKSISNSLLEKTIYWRKRKEVWSLVIMPDSIRIDDNHGYCHIHLEYKKNYHKIQDDTYDAIYGLMVGHIEENNGIDMDKLKKELHFSIDD